MALDRASAQTVARLCVTLAFIGAFCLLVQALAKMPVTPVPLLRTAAMVAAAFALGRREHPAGPSLNRWDETAAYFVLAGAIRLAA